MRIAALTWAVTALVMCLCQAYLLALIFSGFSLLFSFAAWRQRK